MCTGCSDFFVTNFLKMVLDGIFSLVKDYGVSIILFTILVRLCLMPLDFKSRVGMRKMQKLAPKQAELQKKYAKDQEKLQRKLGELYRQEHVSPMSSCWPMLLSMPILFCMFYAMRDMAEKQTIEQIIQIALGNQPEMQSFLWVENLWMPDSPFSTSWPALSQLATVTTEQWESAVAALSEADQLKLLSILNSFLGTTGTDSAITAESLSLIFNETYTAAVNGSNMEGLNLIEFYVATLQNSPATEYAQQMSMNNDLSLNLLFTSLTPANNLNGWFILPIMSAVSQFITSKLSPSQPAPAGTDPEAAKKQASTGAFMKWFFPIFSLFICATSNAAFALYWVTSNLIAMAQNFGINKYLDMKEKRLAASPAGGSDNLI